MEERKESRNVGDIVRIRKWEDMEEEFGLSPLGDIETKFLPFTRFMKPICGKELKIQRVNNAYGISFYSLENEDVIYKWGFTEEMFECESEEYIPSSTPYPFDYFF